MKKFLMPVELCDEKKCNGCPGLDLNEYDWEYICKATDRDDNSIAYGNAMDISRPDWCPLIERREHKIEPSPLTEEEMADYERELKEEQEAHRAGNAALGSLFYRNKRGQEK